MNENVRRFIPIVVMMLILLCGFLLIRESVAQTSPRPVAPKDLAKYWLVSSTSLEALVPNSGRNMDKPSCASVAYVIEANGTTSNIRLEKLYPASDLGSVATSVVQNLRYVPGPNNQGVVPVATRVVLPFNLPPVQGTPERQAQITAYRERVLAQCEPTVPPVKNETPATGQGAAPHQ
ncbi:energy transducer TonB [Tahibacter amnicola]|uniref:Energy transducer TonB n=1 Tax=Tahibacter amnicola TaxID=2976241 RepID=A0ABY6BGK1_9GAMM|nr:energy transducer TonB [Tahibacter amnicola]UXI68889.1 energy transducer TonB [Tahibacter amnicola]